MFFFIKKKKKAKRVKHWAATQSCSGSWGSASSSTDAADWDHLDASHFKYHYPLILILPPSPSLPPPLAQASPQLHTCGCTTWSTFSFKNGCKKCTGGCRQSSNILELIIDFFNRLMKKKHNKNIVFWRRKNFQRFWIKNQPLASAK